MQNEILVGRFGQFASRLFGIKGRNPTPQLSPELVLTMDLGELPDEHRFLTDERVCGGYGSATGGAATLAWCALSNPTGSNNLVVVTSVLVSNGGTNSRFTLRPSGVAPAGTLGTKRFRDPRIPGSPTCVLAQGADAGLNFPASPAGDIASFLVPAPGNEELTVQYVLTPGNTLGVVMSTVNLAFTASFSWRERAIHPSEVF